MPVLKILLLPFAFLYKLITNFRNHLFDSGIKKSLEFDRFVISVGNLTVGGTGKTPFVELLVRELKKEFHLAVLSRGYGRKTKGFRLANEKENSRSIGDEPFQYFTKYGKDVTFAVGEDRALAIPELVLNDDALEVVVLDDAYQHRSVKPHFNILLNDFNRPFYSDFVLPAGLLRESRKHANRADAIVVTKCPDGLTGKEMRAIKQKVEHYSKEDAPVYFTGIKYLKPERLFGNEKFSEDVFLFSGIANARPLEDFVDKNYNLLGHKKFPDHYEFSENDIQGLIKTFETKDSEQKCLVTTEKDMVRLMSMQDEARFLMKYPVFYLPIELYFLRNGDYFSRYLHEKVEKGLKNIEFN